jgi:hypothetical protein
MEIFVYKENHYVHTHNFYVLTALVSSDSESGELSWSLSREECRQSNQHEDWSRYMIGVSTREIELSSQLPPLPPSVEDHPEPLCIEDIPHPVLDKLEGVRKRHQLPARPEPGLGHGLRLLAAASSGQTVRDVGSRIALALNKVIVIFAPHYLFVIYLKHICGNLKIILFSTKKITKLIYVRKYRKCL